MTSEHEIYHPYRFEGLAKKLSSRARRINSGADFNREVEYCGMDDVEFSRRLEVYNQVGWFRQKWVEAGMQIIDASNSQRPTCCSQELDELPAIEFGNAVYIHFGNLRYAEWQSNDPGLPIEGVYLVGGQIAGDHGCLFAIVCAADQDVSLDTVGALLSEQSHAAHGFLQAGENLRPLSFTGGDVSVFDRSTAERVLRLAVFALGRDAENLQALDEETTALYRPTHKPC